MRVYLDNCCYNRPFDDQGQLKIRLETEAKLKVQSLMRGGQIEYAWSDMLCQEVSDSPYKSRQLKILEWMDHATVFAEITDEVVADAADLMSRGLRHADALHLACAKAVDCDWFLTTDVGILKKVREFGAMRVANPVEFIVEEDDAI